MREREDVDRGWKALLIGLATAVAGYLPAAYLYDKITRPDRFSSGEHSLAHSLEVLLIGGPASALVLAAVTAAVAYRGGDRMRRLAWGLVVLCAIASAVIVRWTRLL